MADEQPSEIQPGVTLSSTLNAAKLKYGAAPAFMARRPATGLLKQWLRSMARDEAGAIAQSFYQRKHPDTPSRLQDCEKEADFAAYYLWMESQTDAESWAFTLIKRLKNRKINELIAMVEEGRVLRAYDHDQTLDEHREKDRIRQARHYAKIKALPKSDEELEAARVYEREKKAAYRARKKVGIVAVKLLIPEETALMFRNKRGFKKVLLDL